jgi:hypothetical protein
MDAQALLCRILFRGLVEIREEAYMIKNKKIFHIADLLHNLSLDLIDGTTDQAKFDGILAELRVNAGHTGVDGWLEHVIAAETHDHS